MVVDTIISSVTNQNSNLISPSHRAWMENGILYNEYVGEVSVDRVLENEEKSMEMIREQNIVTLPMIVVFKNIDKSTFKVGIKDYGRIISTFDLSKHVSGAWIVGASEEVKKLVEVVNKVFFAGRMHLVSTLEEAEKGARVLLAAPNLSTLLE